MMDNGESSPLHPFFLRSLASPRFKSNSFPHCALTQGISFCPFPPPSHLDLMTAEAIPPLLRVAPVTPPFMRSEGARQIKLLLRSPVQSCENPWTPFASFGTGDCRGFFAAGQACLPPPVVLVKWENRKRLHASLWTARPR